MLSVSIDSPMTISDRVKQLRKQHGLTQDDLAAKAGVSIATIQRVERGEPPSAATRASIASAFGMTAAALTSASEAASVESASGAYLPLAEITSGKRLVDFVLGSSAIDFDYMEIEDEALADLLGGFYKFCQPRQDSDAPSNPSDRIRLNIEAAKHLKELKSRGLTVAGGIYDRTCHEVADDEDGSMPMLMAKWEETCLVLRVGTGGIVVDRADVYERMGKWTSTSDRRIIEPNKTEATNDDENPFLE
jgi:transcriptional regulator with XRE-family HTH domain